MPAGLVGLMCAKAFGADAVAVTDIKPDNLDLAARLGADATVLLEPPGNPGEVRRRRPDAALRQACALAPGPWGQHRARRAASSAGAALRQARHYCARAPAHIGLQIHSPPVQLPGACAGTGVLLRNAPLARGAHATPAAGMRACPASRFSRRGFSSRL